jgi:NitT/TauT family transport system ATP-binding protein
MPAKGALKKPIEAPPAEPRPIMRARAERPALVAVDLRGACVEFGAGAGTVVALDGLDLTVAPGERVGIVGPSGCGKSTILELVAGLLAPTRGTVEVEGRAQPDERLGLCALMPQGESLLPWRSALDNAALALELAGHRRSEARREAGALFERFGLAGFERARPHELSGGMRQRVAFARTVLAGRPVQLLDEPFAALDAITRAEMQEWLADALRSSPRTVVLVTHDIEEALYLCERVVVLSPRPGRVRDQIFAPPLNGVPRAEAVTAPFFVALRARALEALA